MAVAAGDTLVRLGADYSAKNDAIPLNSGFLARAILRVITRMAVFRSPSSVAMADPEAR